MYKHCNTEESAQRQRQLEQCLLQLMVDVPYDNVTIGQICEHADISRKSFYRYFDSKDDCLHALLDHTIMEGSSYYMFEQEEDDALTFCTRIFEFWYKQTPLLDALERNGQSLQLLQRMVRYILLEEPEYANYMGIGEHNLMEHIVYNVGGIMGLILTWHHEGYQKSPEQMGAILNQMIQR